MKKMIVAAWLALAALTAQAADGYCKVTDPKYIHAGQVGSSWWAYWWCEDGTSQWIALGVQTTQPEVEAWVAWMLGINPQRVGFPPWPPEGDVRIEAMKSAMRAAAAADKDRPPPIVWSVAKNGTYADRPTYPVLDGVRQTKSDGRAKVGATCDCAAPIVEGKTTYCPLAAAAPVPPPEAAGTWVKIASEGGAFTVGTSQRVRFGKDAKWIERTISGAGQCTNAFFGSDPASGVTKQCDRLDAATATPTAPAAAAPRSVAVCVRTAP